MTKKDISEIRKRYRIDRNNFSRIAGCYVNSDKNIVSSFSASPVEIEQDDMFKYIEIAKKSLSGKVGNNLLMFPFRNDDTGAASSDDLLKLKDSGLKDDGMLSSFYQKIIDCYNCAGNFLIMVFYDSYDIPSKASSGEDQDESEYVYDYILVSICPVNLSKPGLGYVEDEDRIGSLVQEWTAAPVESAFMYPAFSDHCGDLGHVTVYSKKPAEPHMELWEALGLVSHLSETEKKTAFLSMVEEVVEDDEHDEKMFEVADGLSAFIAQRQEMQDKDEPVDIMPDDIKDILTDAGIPDSSADNIVDKFKKTFNDDKDRPEAEELLDEKLLKNQKLYHEKRALQLEVMRLNREVSGDGRDNGGISVKLPEDRRSSVHVEEINGVKCAVIPLEDNDISVNGERI